MSTRVLQAAISAPPALMPKPPQRRPRRSPPRRRRPAPARAHHVLGPGRGQVLADVVGANRQLAMAAIGEHGQLHPLGAAVVEQRLDRRADGAPGEEHVVDDHDRAPGHVEVDVRGVHDRGVGPAGDVVAVEADVQVPERDLGVEQLLEQDIQPPGEKRSTAVDADHRPRPALGVALGDLMRDARQRPLHVLLAEDDLLTASSIVSFLASRDRVKGARRMYQGDAMASASSAGAGDSPTPDSAVGASHRSRAWRSDQRTSVAGHARGRAPRSCRSRGAPRWRRTRRAPRREARRPRSGWRCG